MKVSVIIPIYNSEQFLSRAIKSVLNQTFSDIELILVDDGSTDGSSKICKNFEQHDSRVRFLEQSNSGVSHARNRGLQASSGDYTCFLDSDDWIDLNYITDVVNRAEKDSADLVITPYVSESEQGSIKKKLFEQTSKTFTPTEVTTDVFLRTFGPFGKQLRHPARLDDLSPVWGRLYRTSLIRNLSFRDIKEIGSEDLLFNIEFLINADKVSYTSNAYYHYFKENEQSLVHTYRPELTGSWINLLQVMLNLIEYNKLDKRFATAATNRLAINVLNISRNICNSDLSVSKRYATLNEVLHNPTIHMALSALQTADIPVLWRCFYTCAKLRFTAAVLVFNSVGEPLKNILR